MGSPISTAVVRGRNTVTSFSVMNATSGNFNAANSARVRFFKSENLASSDSAFSFISLCLEVLLSSSPGV